MCCQSVENCSTKKASASSRVKRRCWVQLGDVGLVMVLKVAGDGARTEVRAWRLFPPLVRGVAAWL